MEKVTLPMIALRGTIIFPDVISTLDVGRAMSLEALAKASNSDGLIFVAAQKDIAVSDPTPKDIFAVGTVCRIKQSIKLPGENTRVLFEGLYRATIVSYLSKKAFFEVDVQQIIEINSNTAISQALFRQAREQLAILSVVNSNARNKISKELLLQVAEEYDVNKYVNIIANSVIYEDSVKQAILEDTYTESRLEKLCARLTNEIEIAKVDKKIANKVKSSIDKGQKEYYLKEQMKAISEELGEGEDETVEWTDKIKQSKMPSAIAEKALKEVRRMAKMAPSSPDASVIRTYLEWLTDIKWGVETKDNDDLKLAKQILEEDHFGLEKIKERILEYLAVMKLTDSLKSPILCFVGPPGVGKTSIVKSIARALGRNYVRMSLGGVRDEAEIRGHRRTYVGAIPGKIIYLIKQAQCINPVILFDEIDKMSSDFRGDPASAMLEVLDPEQNNTFTDHYLEVPFDLSRTMFVATANTIESIPAALLDRMEIIEINGYTEEEKLQIAIEFLAPKQAKNHGLNVDKFHISKQALAKIISGYTRESGVRNLEREIATICRKVALKCVEQGADEFNIEVDDIVDYLGIEKYINDIIGDIDEVGSATGLAWTSVGGVTLTIDVTLFSGKGEILLTGKLGDVMKESARTAISLVRSKSAEYGIDPSIFEKTDIHVHVPEGATPKDGPSAGVTLATAILSAFTNRAVSKKVAMTGEVTLRGKVLAIGGLKEKALAAYRAGISTIIIPKDNNKDVEEIPEEVKQHLSIIQVADINTVFAAALV